ncbi:MAG: nickel-dependent lactate racemase [Clostridia bacterium]|nr:nickel-dependent lactate racemase [Clostridia bacterium]
MAEKLAFRYGDEELLIPVHGARWVKRLEEKKNTPVNDLWEAFKRAVEGDAIASEPLKALIAPDDQVTIIASDITRGWMHQDAVCEMLVRYLHEAMGLPFENLTVLIALGTHRPHTCEEMTKTVSAYVAERVRLVNHDCQAKDLVYLGDTSRGTPVKVNPLCVGRKVIMIGGTVHHLIAGYGGGRKSIVPGVSGWETIQTNHSYSLHPHLSQAADHVGLGITENNPVHLDMLEAAEMVAPVFGINLVVNAQGKHCAMLCGHWQKAWEASCRLVNDLFGLPIREKADVVIAGCGGFPKDINLYQGVKSLLNANEAVKDGGEIIFLCQCREGGGPPDFFDWIKPLKEGRLTEALRADFTIAGYVFFAMCQVARRCRVKMLTMLPADTTRAVGVEAYQDLQSLLENTDFANKTVYAMPFGGSVLPYLG